MEWVVIAASLAFRWTLSYNIDRQEQGLKVQREFDKNNFRRQWLTTKEDSKYYFVSPISRIKTNQGLMTIDTIYNFANEPLLCSRD